MKHELKAYGMRKEPDEAVIRMIECLEANGFVVGKRDPKINRAFTGRLMVAEAYPEGHAQDDGNGGVWAIVGDNLAFLMRDAISFFDLEVDEQVKGAA